MPTHKFDVNGVLPPQLIAIKLHTSKSKLADTLDLSRESLSQFSGIYAPEMQARLREMMELLIRVDNETGSLPVANDWFRSESLPGIGGKIPNQLVREGNTNHVHSQLNRILSVGYA